MAESTENVVMFGMRGLIGRMLVFKRYFGRTIVAKRPKKSLKPATVDQLAVKQRFREASLYASQAVLDPDLKLAYQAAAVPPQTAFNMAFADYFKAPELSLPQTAGYTGVVGETIRVRAIDNFSVAAVAVSIRKADNSLVEQGPAVMLDNGLDWEYQTTAVNSAPSGSKVEFTATDLPGNNTVLEVVIP